MRIAKIALIAAVLSGSGAAGALADCQIADAKLEEAVLKSPALRGPANRQAVRDLRNLRDAAFTLRSYGRHEDCERLLGNIRELISGPVMSSLGDNDEEEADKQADALKPQIRAGGGVGHRADAGAKPLVAVDSLSPGLRADEIMGAEVRSADDKIVGEVRNIVFGTKDRRDYVIVASGGFFTPGTSSIVVPLQSMQVAQERSIFFLRISHAEMTTIPQMPDQDFGWLTDLAWRARNDEMFAR
ncbi:PRC-barrel domain-containing protein [Hansschlegelia beijingensis]|uniref:PRC-barrel domain-containing protein n=1 Tax=Hansschlegelia beijingensis TaxID=1133344 RepID=A0A7W6D485_9HYPH|nr:PRC-barrel domain-containing protein [Hansschlegelia beijingensis]MBB3971864.1 hypothetical protein [Hansschlegelia beijingensis]